MGNYQTIKDLVIDSYVSLGCMPTYESLTEKVRMYFPLSKWQKSHYSWYKSQINTGKISISEGLGEVNGYSEMEVEEVVSDSIEFQISLEKDLQNYLAQRVYEIENGLSIIEGGVEYVSEAGRIDLLAKDSQGFIVVIELKAGKAKDAALGQILGYIGCLSENYEQVRGILVASDFDARVIFAAKNLPNVKLVKYELKFNLHELK
ncbi:endonuclease NucS [Pokkaliibacter sp. MBI-7]|uniref:endonuclease NucS domain-containing protein n=1 Tax=Pokkaliibacter sp. MBI-7 TaxID=3040600 RepID=UPI002448BF92|nr:endonuclease NucS domain-containing protein [Pokkaliibacter sp. MBI-7]MDH2432525.1 endonuclease NucS [Pokkaliibacter sp. MBI-7]